MESTRCYGCMSPLENGILCPHCGHDNSLPNAPHQLQPGTVLNEQYVIGRVLGQGGFGITYLGWDLYLNIPVAIKEFYPMGVVMRDSSISHTVTDCTMGSDNRFHKNRDRFLKEAKMLARFSDFPEIAQVRTFFLANNTAYIVMEYVRGMTLHNYVQSKGHLTMEEAMAILGPIMRSLDQIHKSGIVHRDLSPDNIMLLPNGRAKLLDFGAVRDMDNISHTVDPIIRSGYSPVEQYQRGGNVGSWTDVHAMCATLVYCLTGTPLPESPERLLTDYELQLKKRIPSLTAQQAQALENGLELRPENRTQTMAELFAALMATEPKPQPPKPEPPKPEPNPGKWILIGVLVVALVLLGLLVIGLASGGGEEEPTEPEAIGDTCGDYAEWSVDLEENKLRITGARWMYDYRNPEDPADTRDLPPWAEYADQISVVEISEDITGIGEYAFAGMNYLKKAYIGGRVEVISRGAFQNAGLTNVSFISATPTVETEGPGGTYEGTSALRYIEEDAFSGTLLNEVTIPHSVEDIAAGAFADCPNLGDVTLAETVRLDYDTWKGPVFSRMEEETASITIHGYDGTMGADYAIIWGYGYDSLGDIGWDEEGDCGKNLFWHLDKETGLLVIDGTGTMDDYNAPYQNGDWHWGYKEDLTFAPWLEFEKYIHVLSIHDGVEEIGVCAFADCESLRDVHFGNTLEGIRYSAFYGNAIDEFMPPDNVRYGSIGYNESLTVLRVGSRVGEFDFNESKESPNLTDIYFYGKDTKLLHGEKYYAYVHPREYEGITLHVRPGSKAEKYAKQFGLTYELITD